MGAAHLVSRAAPAGAWRASAASCRGGGRPGTVPWAIRWPGGDAAGAHGDLAAPVADRRADRLRRLEAW